MIVMRLLSSLKHDESERGIYHLGHRLVKNGHTSIIVASADKDDELVKRLEHDGNIYHQIKMKKKSWWSITQAFALRQLIEKNKPDVIHVHSRTPAWILHWALKGARLKKPPTIISTVYGFYTLNKYAKALFSSDVIISVSDSVTQYLKENLKQSYHYTKPIVRIYRGVDVRHFPYRYNPSVYWLRHIFAEFPELEHKKWLLFPSIIDKEYGQEWLLDILGNLQMHFPNIHAIIMDDDKEHPDNVTYEEFRQRAFALKLDKRITYVGSKRNDMKEWLAGSNLVLALANQPESIGMPVLQAIHLGTPVVGWDKAAHAEILRATYPQGIVKQTDAQAVSKAVKTQLDIVQHPAKTHKFELKQTIDETLQLYQLLHEGKEIPEKFSDLT